MDILSKCLISIGLCAAASGAEAATQVFTYDFDYTSSGPSSHFTLVSTDPSDTFYFDTTLGALQSVEIDWSNITLTNPARPGTGAAR